MENHLSDADELGRLFPTDGLRRAWRPLNMGYAGRLSETFALLIVFAVVRRPGQRRPSEQKR